MSYTCFLEGACGFRLSFSMDPRGIVTTSEPLLRIRPNGSWQFGIRSLLVGLCRNMRQA